MGVRSQQNVNYLIIKLLISRKRLTLINIYCPNDNPLFYNDIQQLILDNGSKHIIFCGDVNLILDPHLDTEKIPDCAPALQMPATPVYSGSPMSGCQYRPVVWPICIY